MTALKQLNRLFQGKKVIIPLILGLLVAVALIAYDFDASALAEFSWTKSVALWLFCAVLMMICRDLGYIIRLRILSDSRLGWKESFQLTFLWEFASAISPGIVGGTAAAFILLAQEKIGTGKSTAIVLATSFLDVLFYVIAVPLLIIFSGLTEHIPDVQLSSGLLSKKFLISYFVIAYIVLFVWAVLVFGALFIRPRSTKYVMLKVFSLPLLKKWKVKANEWGEELIISSKEFKSKKANFWFKAFGATIFSWVARFAAVNFIILAFGHYSDQLEIFIRQLIMWCILILPVTPGASVLAEAIFPSFLSPFFPNISLAKVGAVLWRLLSYYPYLLIGFIIFPIWIKRIIAGRQAPQLEEK